jgi:predicted Zn-dependent peptidase
MIGNQSYSIYNPKRYVLTLLNNVLGGDWMSSRLNMIVREKHAYAYNVSSNYNAYRDTGTFSVQLGTDGKYLNKCISLINKEFKKLRETKLSTMQLNRAKTQLMSQFEMYIENPGSLMQIHGRQILDHGRTIPRSEYFENIKNITSNDVIEVANEILNQESLSTLLFKNE